MIKSRLTLTLLAACAVLAAAWPFRYQLYLFLPSEPVERLQARDGLYWQKGKPFTGRMTETDMLKSGGLMTVTPVIDGLKDGRAVTFDEREPVAIAHWEAGSLEGPFERRSAATGELLESAFYKKGRLEGERRLYDEKARSFAPRPMPAGFSRDREDLFARRRPSLRRRIQGREARRKVPPLRPRRQASRGTDLCRGRAAGALCALL